MSQTSHTDSSISNPLINGITLIQWFFQASHRLDRMNYTATTGFEIQDKQIQKMQFIVALNNSADTAKLNLLPTSLNTKLHHGSKVASSLASWTNGRGR